MKTRIPLILSIVLLLIMAGCGTADNTPHEDPSLTYMLETSDEVPFPTPEPEEAPGRAGHDLVGKWVFAHFTRWDDETPQPWFYEHFTPSLVIREDGTFKLFNYGSMEGDLVQTGDCQFIGANLVASSEGYTWYPEDGSVWLTYHTESGLVQYTFFNEYGPFYFHLFFARALESMEQEMPEPAEQEATEHETPEPVDTATAELDISHIPYFGDFAQFRLPAEHALAYAEAIKTAYLDIGWGHFSFDILYPVLIDVSGDGVPLLLLAERDDTISWGDAHWNMLFGFADGKLQRITAFPTGIGIAMIDYEPLLALVFWHDFGGEISLYRVQNGGAGLVSKTRFFSDWHNEAFYIDDVEVSEYEFWGTVEGFSIVHLMETTHPLTVHSLPAFEEYLSRPFTREQVVRIFWDYYVAYR